MLTPIERRELLDVVRSSVDSAIGNREFSPQVREAGGLAEKAGVFVTIRMGGHLRGCVGYIESSKPLIFAASEVAVQAALNDRRFSPLSISDLHQSLFEVSILSPLKPVLNIEEIEVGKHGLVLEYGQVRSLLLPQVAIEHNLNREEFLDALAVKGGLPSECARSEQARISCFTAEVVREEDMIV